MKYIASISYGIAPLADFGITEAMTYEINKKNGLLNPLYDVFDRLGCWFCPKQSIKSLKKVRNLYPELWEKMLEWDKLSPCQFSPKYSLQDLEQRFLLNGDE